MKIAIVGSGVIGLSVACRLSETAESISVFSGQDSSQTTSAVAAAYWGPYFIGQYDRAWAVDTWHELHRLASDPVLARESGTCMVDFREWLCDEDANVVESQLLGVVDLAKGPAALGSLARSTPSNPTFQSGQSTRDPSEISLAESQPYWWRTLPGVDFELSKLNPIKTLHFPETGPCEFTSEIRFRSAVARMPDYLRYLQSRAESTGKVQFVIQWVEGFDDLIRQFDVVVNCTGFGAKRLVAHDPSTANMRLLAGLVVRVETEAQTHAFSLGHGAFAKEPLYIIPRQGTLIDSICGGTAIEIVGDIDPQLPFPLQIDGPCERIYQRCSAASDAIRKGIRRENLAGLRPVRDAVRIERDPSCERLIHCYGHGGSGLTLSWGSANRVAELIGLVAVPPADS